MNSLSKGEKELSPHKRGAPRACTQPRHSAEIPTYLMNERTSHAFNELFLFPYS